MAKFPTEAESSIVINVPCARAYAFFLDVANSARCIPGFAGWEPAGPDTYRFTFAERSTGPVSLAVRYTARYIGDGTGRISFEGVGAADDNSDVHGEIRLEPQGGNATRVTLRQMVAPDLPIPRLLQGLLRGYAEREASTAVEQYLANVKRTLETA